MSKYWTNFKETLFDIFKEGTKRNHDEDVVGLCETLRIQIS